jgi:hypothetical protein
MTPIQIDSATYLALQNAAVQAAESRRMIKQQTETQKEADATIASIILPRLPAQQRSIVPGLMIAFNREVVLDHDAVLAYATDPKQAAYRSVLLTPRKEALATLVQLVAEHAPEQLAFLFDVNPSTYLQAVDEMTFFDLPAPVEIKHKPSVKIELKYLDVLNLADGFEIVETTEAVDQGVNDEPSA